MSDNKTFKNLGKFLSYEEKELGGTSKVVIKYTQPKYQDPAKVWTVSIGADQASEKLLDTIVNASAGEEYCIHTKKNEDKPGLTDLVDITDKADAEYVPAQGKSTYSKGKFTPKDETGIAVGAAYTNAIAILALEGGAPAGEDTVAIVDNIARKVLANKLKLEAELRANKATTTTKTETETAKAPVAEAPKPLTALQKAKLKKKEEAVVELEEIVFEDE